MHSVLALGAFLVAASPASSGLAELQASASRLSQVKLEEKGEVKVEAVRRRLGALAALTGAAKPILRGDDLTARLQAHLALGEAHEAFARELFSAKAPAAARGESLRAAWAEQIATTVERALETARAHLRSCVDLGAADAATAASCAKALERVGDPATKGGAKSGSPASIAARRTGELQACYDAHRADHPDVKAVEISARLSVDSVGRVDDVALSPSREDARALYDCLSDALWIWTFPGTADVELELPIRLAGPKTSKGKP